MSVRDEETTLPMVVFIRFLLKVGGLVGRLKRNDNDLSDTYRVICEGIGLEINVARQILRLHLIEELIGSCRGSSVATLGPSL